MSAVDVAVSHDTQGRAVEVSRALAARSLLLIPRIPSTFFPSLVMPVVITLAFSGAFGAIARGNLLPTAEILNWMAPMAIIQGAAFAGITTGMGIARDVENGFFDRLLLAPTPRSALIAGPLVASVARAALPVVLVLVVALLGGARFEQDALAGLAVLVLMAEMMAVCAGAWSLALVFKFRSLQAAPIMQVGLFITFFLSTAQVPLRVMTGWLHSVARFNPMTNVLRAARQGFLGPVTWHDTWPGIVALLVLGGVLVAWSVRGLRRMTP